jgi:hypothetical protein
VAKISDLRRYAQLKGVDVRTVRGWCETGKIPAKKWKRDGRWHLHRLLIAKEESIQYIRAFFHGGDGKRPPTARDMRAFEYGLLKQELVKESPFLTGAAIALSYKPDPDVKNALLQPYEDIFTAADWLKQKNGSVPTIKKLAQHLRISKSALYGRLHEIAEVLKQRYNTDDPPEGVASLDDLYDPLTGKLVAKPKSKEKLNRHHDGDHDRD